METHPFEGPNILLRQPAANGPGSMLKKRNRSLPKAFSRIEQMARPFCQMRLSFISFSHRAEDSGFICHFEHRSVARSACERHESLAREPNRTEQDADAICEE